ncbi:lysophospholipase [Fomitopsis serialis]|uniref:lysophospholipase n=1 Tax=Fomitopsis serialis TaxID=139415 RepID=UPI002007652D|nr:lysophospholipase [Neoantrodia serialis]KAH9913545.1 lysophospholipase [Neoantrodia serialis]
MATRSRRTPILHPYVPGDRDGSRDGCLRARLRGTRWPARARTPVLANKDITVFTFDQRGFGKTALDAEHKSRDAAYGKETFEDQMRDIEFWVQHMKKEHPDLPLFLVGQSMGGGLVLSFPTQSKPPPAKESVELLTGVIGMSPLISQTAPVSRLLRKAGAAMALLTPWLPFPAEVPPEDLSHDPAVCNAIDPDPLIKKHGTFRGLADMLSMGEHLLYDTYKNWPKKLPVLLLHGTQDKVTSHKASEELYGKLDAEDKKLSLYEDAYHELTNEPDGVKERFWDECIAWIHAHVLEAHAETARL